MPEGDTIRYWARNLEPLLLGAPLVTAEVRAGDFGFRGERERRRRREGVNALTGRYVTHIEPVGKHMMLWFDDGPGLRIHLGLAGMWHAYDPGARWRLPEHAAGLMLRTARAEVVCFHPMHVEWLDPRRRATHPMLSRLGPDLAEEQVDFDVVVRRAERFADVPVGVVLLDQQVAAGVGNVIRSEVCFLEGVHPLAPTSGRDLYGLFRCASQVIRDNSHRLERVTTSDDVRRRYGRRALLNVYGRHTEPCYACMTPIEVRRIGNPPRGVWWCSSCQIEGAP